MKDEEKVLNLVAMFNQLMPDHLHIGLVPKWTPEHPPKSEKKRFFNGTLMELKGEWFKDNQGKWQHFVEMED